MDLCHLKRADLANNLQTFPGVWCSGGDNVKDACGYRAVFGEQGASASQMASAKFLDRTSKFLGKTGEASDAVSIQHTLKS